MKRKPQNITVAVKRVGNIAPDFEKEVSVMSGVVHPNIIELYGLINRGKDYHTVQ